MILQRHTEYQIAVFPVMTENTKPKERIMDAQAIIQSMQALPERERAKVSCLIAFLHWRHNGGTKTAEIKRGEKLYKQFERTQSAKAPA